MEVDERDDNGPSCKQRFLVGCSSVCGNRGTVSRGREETAVTKVPEQETVLVQW